MTVYELTREQLDELAERYVIDMEDNNENWWAERNYRDVTDEEVLEYGNCFMFGNDDFFCTAGMDDDEAAEKPIDDFIKSMQEENKWYGALNIDEVSDLLHNTIKFVAETIIKNKEESYRFIPALADIIGIPDSEIEMNFDADALLYNMAPVADKELYR